MTNETTLAAFGGNEQRATVFLDRYAMKNAFGQAEEEVPAEMWRRAADEMGSTDAERTRFYLALAGHKVVPGGRILAGAGTGHEVTYYNCYVIPVETRQRRSIRAGVDIVGVDIAASNVIGNDSREAIFDTIGAMVDIMSRGGGVGINWSVLRPKGAYLKRVNGTSSGPIGWMDVASKAVGEVEQGGSRRGAAMFMLDDWHPDILNFIDAKRELSRITNANVSVAVSDEFMRAVRLDLTWNLRFPDTSHPAYDAEWDGDMDGWVLRHGWESIKVYDTVKARDIWRKLAQAAWDNGEPGVVFLDRYNELSTAKGVERLISVNPCGEQGLGPYSVCNLGSMNLSAYVTEANPGPGAKEAPELTMDWHDFERDVATAVRFLDAVIDKNYYFLPENEKVQKELRRIGLGVMGLADALIKQGLRYGSPEAVAFTENVFQVMKDAAVRESMKLAQEKGAAPAWDDSMWDRPYLKDYADRHDVAPGLFVRRPLRNVFLLTQAPTGTTSILAGVNSGIEPYFAFSYTRKDRTGTHKVNAAIVEELKPTVLRAAPGYVGGEWVTAEDITVEEHIAMQAAAQKYIDSSVSKTINAPNSHTVEDVEKAFTLAYDSGLKGLAYFRDGCGRAQVLTRDETKVDPSLEPARVAVLEESVDYWQERSDQFEARANELQLALKTERAATPRVTRPAVLEGRTRKVRTTSGSAYVTVNRDEAGAPYEVFVLAGKTGSDVTTMAEALGRMASLALQRGALLSSVGAMLEGIGGYSKFAKSLPSAIGHALMEEFEEVDAAELPKVGIDAAKVFMGLDLATKPDQTVYTHVIGNAEPVRFDLTFEAKVEQPTGQLCPDCQSFSVVREEGCSKCHVCGWSAC